MDTEAPLLADLCKICHTNLPKYRCPRCSARTCSLPCTKRHKLWAQCSGVRDPAAYKTRGELATPSGIDQDFNFITGIERSLERADREAAAKGVFDRERNVRRYGPEKGKVNVDQALETRGINIVRAPTGMSRGKVNRTSWNKNQRCLSWTIEWILDDGSKTLGNCLDITAISEVYARQAQPSKPKTNKKKRRRKVHDPRLHPLATSPPEASQATRLSSCQEPPALLSETQEPENPQSLSSPKLQDHPPTAPEAAQSSPSQEPLAPLPEAQEPEIVQSPPPSNPQDYHFKVPKISPSSENLQFYLHIPHPPYPTPRKTALLPLLPTSILSSTLAGRTVLEFPTIYVLPYPPDQLPERFAKIEAMGESAEEISRKSGEELQEEEGELREIEEGWDDSEDVACGRRGVSGEVDLINLLDDVVGDA